MMMGGASHTLRKMRLKGKRAQAMKLGNAQVTSLGALQGISR
jgi:hypothetical protein